MVCSRAVAGNSLDLHAINLKHDYLQIGLLQKINALPAIPRIEDKSPIEAILVYAALNLSGADRTAPVFNGNR